jgi:hypothetical protein
MTGRQADALRSYERAVALDPAPVRRGLKGMSLFLNNRAQEALPVLRKAFVDSDHLPIIGGWLVDVLDFLGEYEESAQLRIGGGFDPEEIQNLTRALRAGDAELLSETAMAALTPVQWMLFNEPDRAAETLTKHFSPFEQGASYYIMAPSLDPVRDTPQMEDLLRRMNLEGVQLQRTPPSEAPTP